MGVQLPPFERVIESHGPAVLRFCASRVGHDRADECFLETMLAALRAYDDVRDPAATRSWVFSIAARKTIDAHRARTRAPQPVADLEPLIGAAPVADPDDTIWEHVRALPARQREAVTLRLLGDLSHGEIGAAMRTSGAAARRNVFEGLKRLREEVES